MKFWTHYVIANCPPVNLAIPEQQAFVQTIQKNSAIVVLPADKGRATVIMDNTVYEQKVAVMLSDKKTYERLEKIQLLATNVDWFELLVDSKKKDAQPAVIFTPISIRLRKKFLRYTVFLKYTSKDVPFRPVVDYTGSIGYNTS